MIYKLGYTAQAKRQIDGLPTQKIRNQIESALLRIAERPSVGKRLQGDLADFLSYRTGNYGIVYQVFHSEVKVLIIALGDRRDIYKKL